MQLNNRNKGFSLIELLVAIAVMSIIMVMVVQMMGNSSVILRKTNKKLELQTEALEFREQFSDIVMQATYIRVETADKKTYTLDTGIDSSAKNKRKRIATSVGDINGTLVSDNYPNYKLAGSNNYDIYMKSADYTLYCIDNTKTVHNSDSYQSFRKLLDGVSSGNPYYVKPSYIYIRYHIDNSANTENYAIFRFVDNSGSYSVFADKGTVTNTNTATDDGFNAAKTAVDAKSGYTGLMSENVKDVYFSVDAVGNSAFVDMQFENAKYINQTYEYRDTISLRNSYAITVAPNKMFLDTTP